MELEGSSNTSENSFELNFVLEDRMKSIKKRKQDTVSDISFSDNDSKKVHYEEQCDYYLDRCDMPHSNAKRTSLMPNAESERCTVIANDRYDMLVNKCTDYSENSPYKDSPSLGESSESSEGSENGYICSSDSETIPEELDIVEDLKHFWRETNQTTASMTNLLRKLKPHFPALPLDARTLIPVERKNAHISKKTVHPGFYIHFGLRTGLETVLAKNPRRNVVIALHIDGVSIYKSAIKEFWTILASIVGTENTVFLAGLYFGESKPECPNEFLDDTITELEDVLERGITIEGRQITVEFSHCACDSIAKAFIKAIKFPTGFHGCDRCTQRGVTIDGSRRFLEHFEERRTDASFRGKDQPDHHRGDSPFLRLRNINMINAFPNDYMHSVCEGTVFKILDLLRQKGSKFRLTGNMLEQLNSEIILSRESITCDFQRRPRNLLHLSKWKATELRFFCLYFGPILIGKYNKNLGRILQWLGVILRMLCHKTWSKDFNDYCLKLVDRFLFICRTIIGDSFLTMNVHSLVHLVEDCRTRGSADNFSCFEYESFLRFVLNSVHSSNKPLEQVCNQVLRHGQQLTRNQPQMKLNDTDFILKRQIVEDSLSGSHPEIHRYEFESYFRSITLKNTEIKVRGPNRYILSNSGLVMKVKFVALKDGAVWFLGKYLKDKSPIFDDPMTSTTLDIVSGSIFSFSLKCFQLKDMKCKLLRYKNNFYPLIHTY